MLLVRICASFTYAQQSAISEDVESDSACGWNQESSSQSGFVWPSSLRSDLLMTRSDKSPRHLFGA